MMTARYALYLSFFSDHAHIGRPFSTLPSFLRLPALSIRLPAILPPAFRFRVFFHYASAVDYPEPLAYTALRFALRLIFMMLIAAF